MCCFIQFIILILEKLRGIVSHVTLEPEAASVLVRIMAVAKAMIFLIVSKACTNRAVARNRKSLRAYPRRSVASERSRVRAIERPVFILTIKAPLIESIRMSVMRRGRRLEEYRNQFRPAVIGRSGMACMCSMEWV